MKDFLHDITKHSAHYLSLIGIIGAGFLGFLLFPYDQIFRSTVVVALGISFVIWGVVHHFIHEDLHIKVVWEYIMTALLATVILLSLIWK